MQCTAAILDEEGIVDTPQPDRIRLFHVVSYATSKLVLVDDVIRICLSESIVRESSHWPDSKTRTCPGVMLVGV